ncbi:TetR/AcrR family transcriptional regulator [Actinospica robiniae]|uniref:TetR/AcrR family transcriptional regulator n=1 Tax=Actinospica robiniae TaxID=304901 RepID=UPI00042057F1|nr:TetR/AcrR family transcriptional regulator [Actinospica robiniae]
MPDADDPARTPTRRRGAALEAALLEAAWAELAEVGYPALTMENVAARAGTGRAVLYRRWPSRSELVLAALKHHQPQFSAASAPPDTGSLREDVLSLLRDMSSRTGELMAGISFMFADYYSQTGESPAVWRERFMVDRPSSMPAILDRAIARGEADPARITDQVLRLPVDLVRHDLIMTLGPVPESTLVKIVDELFLPLVRP